MKTPLQMFEEREQKQCCLQCSKLIEKQGTAQKVYFCGHSGKIILPRFLDCGNLSDCSFERKEVRKMIGIKDMDMPCDCWNCDCTFENYIGATVCVFTRNPLYPMGSQHERDKECPLVEVAEHCGIG